MAIKKNADITCSGCGLYKHCKTPRMKPYGNFRKGIMVIGEAPGEVEDRVGMPWQGRTGKLLQRTYRSLGINLFEDCVSINSVNCRPTEEGQNRAPSNYEITCCRQVVYKAIDRYKPRVVVLLGNSALVSIIGNRWKRDMGTITKWRGWTIPDRGVNAWLCPTFHPSYVERAESREVDKIWELDLRSTIECSKINLPTYVEPTIETISDLTVLDSIKSDTVAFDYETTGLKPHAMGHRIICASVADTPDHAYVFMMPTTRQLMRPFINLLANTDIAKMAHNMKYEDTWSVVRLRQTVNNWKWDSMLAAHIEDNRSGVTGLKFQTYVNFGISDYSSDVDKYLKPKVSKDGNALNQIPKLIETSDGIDKLLHYCGLDSIYEYRLAVKQQSKYDET